MSTAAVRLELERRQYCDHEHRRAGSQDLTIAAGTAAGTTTVTGNVSALGDGTGAALTVNNSATGLVDFQGTFGANSGLTGGAGTSLKFGQNVTLADGDTVTNLAGAVTLDGLDWSSSTASRLVRRPCLLQR